jgi:hypothetical protein
MEVSGQHHAPTAFYPRGKHPGTHYINEEFHICTIIMTIKSRIRWAIYEACMRDMTNAHKIFLGKPQRKISLIYVNIAERIILNWTFRIRLRRRG